ncbi:MAG TPA: TolC family protein [Verrucomicrobiae bacterium]|nr:TolC family protein [Verrucomicrobiae bacterium]
MKFIVAAFIFAVGPIAAYAQPNDSLDALVAAALTNNPEIATARRKWDAALQRIPQARSLDDPMLGVDAWRKNSGADSPSQTGLMVSQNIPWFGKRDLRGGMETGAAKQAEMAWRMKTLEVVAMVKQAWYDLWQAQRELDLNQRDQELMQQFVEVARSRYETGKASQSDLIRAQNELAKLSEDRVDRTRTYQQALAEMNRLMRRDPATPVVIGPEETVTVSEPAVTLDQLQAAAACRPELQGLQEGEVRSAEAALALAKKGYEPDLQVRLEAWEYEGKGGLQEYDAGVSINFPWVNGGRHGAAIREARANLDASRDELDAMRARTAAEVKKLYDGVEAMHHHYELYVGKLIPQQQLALDAARAAYESGTGGFLDVIDAHRTLLDLEMQNLHHAAEFQRLLASLERVAGGRLPLAEIEKEKK